MVKHLSRLFSRFSPSSPATGRLPRPGHRELPSKLRTVAPEPPPGGSIRVRPRGRSPGEPPLGQDRRRESGQPRDHRAGGPFDRKPGPRHAAGLPRVGARPIRQHDLGRMPPVSFFVSRWFARGAAATPSVNYSFLFQTLPGYRCLRILRHWAARSGRSTLFQRSIRLKSASACDSGSP